MRIRPSIVALLVGVVLVLAVGGTMLGFAPWADNTCSPLRGPCQRVLFLGNSYTYVNDLPAVFRHLSRAGGHEVETAVVAEGGETLAMHLTSSASLGAIDAGGWSFVVLQEQSQIPAVATVAVSQTVPAVEGLVGQIRAHGQTPVLFETWAHEYGWPEQHLDRAAMQAAIDSTYERLGSRLGVRVAEVGRAWEAALAADPTIQLWSADGSHPSLAGTYLAACVLYARLFDATPVGLSATEGLDAATATALQRAAEAAR